MPRIFFSVLFLCSPTLEGHALEKGALLYHTSANGIIYGSTGRLELPCSVLEAVLGELRSGHTGLSSHTVRDRRKVTASQLPKPTTSIPSRTSFCSTTHKIQGTRPWSSTDRGNHLPPRCSERGFEISRRGGGWSRSCPSSLC